MLEYLFVALFCAALVITFFTDYYSLLIHRGTTLFIIPLFLLGAYLNVTPVGLFDSIFGAVLGYGCLWIFNYGYYRYKGIQGIGQGDFELLAMIGSFLGPVGALYSLTLGSIIGTLYACILMALNKADHATQLPFGSFLVLGALTQVVLNTFNLDFFY